MKWRIALVLSLCAFGAQAADTVTCDLSSYKAQAGLTAEMNGPALVVGWSGDADQNVRLRLSVNGGTPTLDEIAVRRGEGSWSVLSSGVVPEFSVTTGLRRVSNQQLMPLHDLGVKITPENLGKYRWDPFWDAPLDMSVPDTRGGAGVTLPPVAGVPGTDQPGLPRKPEEIQHADTAFAVKSCKVISDGARLTITYPGVTLGVFSGSLRFTIFKGTNLIRQEVVATTRTPWIAYKYDAGLRGLAINSDSGVAWRDTTNTWQTYAFGGQPNPNKVPLRAANRLVLAQQGAAGSIAAFPPPHKFFWSRELATVMGYNWYRKDTATSYSIGIRQNEHEADDEPAYSGVWALYSARPGTEQLMTVFLYPSLSPRDETAAQVLAFTHNDHYAPLPDFQVMQHHYHMDLGQRLIAAGNPAAFLPDLEAIKAVGVNIVSQLDQVILTNTPAQARAAESTAAAAPRGRPDQLAVTAASVEGARLTSDRNFLIMASQEVFNSPLGGHTDLLFSHPVYWDQRRPGQPFTESSPKFGKVYHVGGVDDFMAMVEEEKALISMPHPRTKGSTGFPDAVKDTAFFHNPRYHGFGLRWGMGLDGSERRTCENRCLPLLDDMANWMADRPEPLKYAISISEVRHEQPGDDIYGGSPVTYVHLKALPPPDDTSPVIDALMKGDMFITTGEVLVPHFEIRGTGNRRTAVADVQWTFPLEMVEIVWGDGKTTGRQVISATQLPPFGTHRFEIPFDAKGKKWVRFAVWDSAYEGAILQPQRLR